MKYILQTVIGGFEDLISFIVQYITIKHLKLLISFHLNVIIIILFERWDTHKKLLTVVLYFSTLGEKTTKNIFFVLFNRNNLTKCTFYL